MSSIDGQLIKDKLKGWCWKTRDGKVIPIPEISDLHLRNIALFLMGMGYIECIADNSTRIMWLTVLRVEWERRLRTGIKKWRVSPDNSLVMELDSKLPKRIR